MLSMMHLAIMNQVEMLQPNITRAQFDYTPNDKLALNAGYTALNNLEAHDVKTIDLNDDSLGIWYAGW